MYMKGSGFESAQPTHNLPLALSSGNDELTFSSGARHNRLPKYALCFEASDGTAITINNSFYAKLASGYHRQVGLGALEAFLRDFGDRAQRILQDPHGPDSIDRERETHAGRWARIVHSIKDGPLVDFVGAPIAVKGTGMEMDLAHQHLGDKRGDLLGRFYKLLEASKVQQERYPQGVGGCLFFNEPYAVIRYLEEPDGRMREWLLSPFVGGEPMEDQQLAFVDEGYVSAFDPTAYPDLARIATSNPYDPVLFPDLARAIAYQLDFSEYDSPVRDLHGGNIFAQKADGRDTYTIIDL